MTQGQSTTKQRLAYNITPVGWSHVPPANTSVYQNLSSFEYGKSESITTSFSPSKERNQTESSLQPELKLQPRIPKQSWRNMAQQHINRTSSSPRLLKFLKFYSPAAEEASCSLLAHQRLTHCSTRASKALHYLYVLKRKTRKKGQKCSNFVYAQPAVPLSPMAKAQIFSSSESLARGLAFKRLGRQPMQSRPSNVAETFFSGVPSDIEMRRLNYCLIKRFFSFFSLCHH